MPMFKNAAIIRFHLNKNCVRTYRFRLFRYTTFLFTFLNVNLFIMLFQN
jgi:hypothetical protein